MKFHSYGSEHHRQIFLIHSKYVKGEKQNLISLTR